MWMKLCLAGVAIGIFLIRWFQYRLLYFPQLGYYGEKMPDPSDCGVANWKRLSIPIEGTQHKILGYLLQYPPSGRTLDSDSWKKQPTIVYFHGNAGNVGDRLPIATSLQEAVKCNVLMVAYRGYRGSSQVPPSESVLTEDAIASLHALRDEGVDTNKVFVLGTSLGGAVTLAAALRSPYRIRGLAIENTFTSIGDMTDILLKDAMTQLDATIARRRSQAVGTFKNAYWNTMAYSPAAISAFWKVSKPVMLSLQWHSHKRIKQLRSDQHILFLSGSRDELIPPDHMHALYSACSSEKKKFVSFPRGMHNNTCWQNNWPESIGTWVNECLAA
eukprot:TRINITY_DN16340_c0_g1_i1.p1 TRINITY_DN16340_c0_g1~~TRINITY_DN16340_c0_g1_i1.p1  ORF type:complete len:330 (+),score=40.90 TRINITY_DN16340_c0_g1_i1:143-1132(+)